METNKKQYTKCEWKTDHSDYIPNIFGIEVSEISIPGEWIAYVRGNSKEQKKANADRIVECVNGYDSLFEENKRLKDALEGIGNVLDFCINATPTGAVRNLLTDANIIAKTVLDLSTVKEVGDNG